MSTEQWMMEVGVEGDLFRKHLWTPWCEKAGCVPYFPRETQKSIWAWFSSLPDFGTGPSLRSAVDRIKEEWDELDKFEEDLLTKEDIVDELADIIITCYATGSLFGVDVESRIREKMEINRKRKWRKSEEGNYYHIKE